MRQGKTILVVDGEPWIFDFIAEGLGVNALKVPMANGGAPRRIATFRKLARGTRGPVS